MRTRRRPAWREPRVGEPRPAREFLELSWHAPSSPRREIDWPGSEPGHNFQALRRTVQRHTADTPETARSESPISLGEAPLRTPNRLTCDLGRYALEHKLPSRRGSRAGGV